MQRPEEKEQEGSRLHVTASGITGSHIRDEGGDVMRQRAHCSTPAALL